MGRVREGGREGMLGADRKEEENERMPVASDGKSGQSDTVLRQIHHAPFHGNLRRRRKRKEDAAFSKVPLEITVKS